MLAGRLAQARGELAQRQPPRRLLEQAQRAIEVLDQALAQVLHGQRLTGCACSRCRSPPARLRMGRQTKQGRGQKGRGKRNGACSPRRATRARGEVHQISLT